MNAEKNDSWFYNKFSKEDMRIIFDEYCLEAFGKILPLRGTGRCSLAAALEALEVPVPHWSRVAK